MFAATKVFSGSENRKVKNQEIFKIKLKFFQRKQTKKIMKKSIVLMALLMGVSVANVSVASDGMAIVNLVNSDLDVKTLEGLKFKLTATNLQKKTYLTIKDNSGNVLYSEYYNDGAFVKVFDLSSLPDGKYTFVMESGSESVSKPFEIATSVNRSAVSLSK